MKELAPPSKIIEQEKLKQKYLKNFLNYRNNWIDEIPPPPVNPNDPNFYLSKCRAHFFLFVSRDAFSLIAEKVMTEPDVVARCKEFDDFVKKLNEDKWQQLPEKPTTKEEIQYANDFLDYIIAKLKEATDNTVEKLQEEPG